MHQISHNTCIKSLCNSNNYITRITDNRTLHFCMQTIMKSTYNSIWAYATLNSNTCYVDDEDNIDYKNNSIHNDT